MGAFPVAATADGLCLRLCLSRGAPPLWHPATRRPGNCGVLCAVLHRGATPTVSLARCCHHNLCEQLRSCRGRVYSVFWGDVVCRYAPVECCAVNHEPAGAWANPGGGPAFHVCRGGSGVSCPSAPGNRAGSAERALADGIVCVADE